MDNKTFKILLAVIIVATPIILSPLLIHVFHQASIFDFVPEGYPDRDLLWADEMYYWHQTLSFVKVGFDSGHYAVNEMPSPSSFFNFGPHGPSFPVLYGLVGYLTGWHYYTGVIINIALISLAIAMYLYITKPDIYQLVLIELLLLSFWPLHLYIPSNLQEVLNYSIAVVIAGLFYSHHKRGLEIKYGAALVGFLLLVSLLRPTWSFLIIPVSLSCVAGFSRKRALVAIAMSTVLIAVAFAIYRWLCAPYPYGFIYELTSILNGKQYYYGAEIFVRHLIVNLSLFFRFEDENALKVLQRVQVLFVVLASLYFVVRDNFKKSKIQYVSGPPPAALIDISKFHLFNLAMILLFTLSFYDMRMHRDFRLFAPHLLLSLLLAVAFRKYFIAIIVVVSLIVFAPQFIGVYNKFHAQHFENPDNYFADGFKRNVSANIEYRHADNPWCNTLLTDVKYFPFYKYVPGGIGINFTLRWNEIAPPIKSRYVLVPKMFMEENLKMPLQESSRFELINRSIFGELYVNHDIECGLNAR